MNVFRQVMEDLKKKVERLDWLTTQLTGQESFHALVSASEGQYVPTFCGDQRRKEERKELADAFDEARKAEGWPVSHRCHSS